MKLFSDSYRMAAALLVGACLLSSCQKGDSAFGDRVEVDMQIGAHNVIGTRVFSNDDPLSVDRILVIPFTKSNAAAEDNANYTAEPGLAVQMDVDGFPVTDLKMLLSPLSTCKLVVFGFNRQNYDFHNSDPSTDGLVIDYGGTLAELSIEDRAAARGTSQSAELFYDVSDPFRPGSGTSVSANLVRMVGGLSVTLTNVPDGVEMRLYHTAPFTTRWMVIGATAAGSFDTQDGYYSITNNGGGTHYYSRYYFPTGSTPITMDIEAIDPEASPKRVPVATSSGSQFTLVANQAINLRGDYRSIILGQELFVSNPSDNGVHIDDDNWDGVDDTPATDPDGTDDPTVNP